ncbi:MAG: hypothetical protein ACI9XK_004066 [Granulosicoccus sp.]|jgi:hypothetical protein
MLKDVAGSLYINPFMLFRWRKQVRAGVIVSVSEGNEIDKDVAA